MSGTDYAADLLGGKEDIPVGADRVRVGEADAPVDYAAALFGPTLQRENAKRPKEMSLSDLKLANQDSHSGTADFTTLIKAGMVDDPGTKIRIFAQARFPKLDPKEAVARYGIVEGHVIYAGDDGKIYREDPPGFTGWLKDNLAAGTLANAPAILGGIAGGVAGAELGPPGMVAGGAAGAAAGKGYGKVIANLALDEPQSSEGNAKAMVTEGLWTAGGNFAGAMFGKVLTKNLARDIGKLDDAAVADLKQKAASLGVELDPAQLTNLPSLKAKKDVLASMPTARDIIADGAKKQAGQARNAIDRFLKGVSSDEGLDEAGTAARDAAGKVITMLTSERAAAASPLYKRAFEQFEQIGGVPAKQPLPELSDFSKKLIDRFRKSGSTKPVDEAIAEAERQGFPNVIDNLNAYQGAVRNNQIAGIFESRAKSLMARPAMNEAGKKAVMLAKNEGIDLADPKNSLLGMHYMKLALDDMIEGAGQQGFGGTYKRGLVGIKEQLLGIMDDLSPTYGEARKVFQHFSPNVTSVKEGIVSKLADLGDEQVFKASQMVFGGNVSPNTVARTKELFERAGMKDNWNAMLKAYLEDSFEQAGKQFKTMGGAVNQAPNWQVAMTGSPRQYRILEKAMDPGEFQAFKNMLDVFEAMGRTRGAGAGSQTMPRQEAARILRQESGSGVVGQAAQLLSPQTMGARVGEWLQEVRLGNHAQNLAEVMTSPDGMKKLRELKRLSPNDQRFIAGASSLFGIELKPADRSTDYRPNAQ